MVVVHITSPKGWLNKINRCNVHFMSEIPFDWDDLRLFLAIARLGGLAAAADVTGKSAPTLGRRMLALEQTLGRDLFLRQSQGYSLTEHGHELLNSVIAMEAGIEPILSCATQRSRPRVKVSAGTWVTHYLCGQLKETPLDQSLTLQFISADHLLDIGHREAVIGVRNSKPTQSMLAGQPINTIDFAVYAISGDVQLWSSVISNTPSARWLRDHIGDSHCIETTEPRNALDLTLAGLTRAVLPTFIGDQYNTLVRLSDEIPVLQHQQWLVSHHEDRNRPEVRLALDWVRDVLGDTSVLR